MRRKNNFYLLLSLPSIILVAVMFVFPLVAVFSASLSGNSLSSVLSESYTYRLLLFTLGQAALSALISIVLAIPFALFFSTYTFKGRKLVMALTDTAFVLPSIIVVLSFVIWYGNNGLLNNFLSYISGGKMKLSILYSYRGVILAHVYLNFPLAFSILTGAMISAGESEEKAASSLGAGKMRVFFTVTLYKIKGSIYQTFLLILLFCFPSFLIVMTLGGSPKYYTIEAEIYRRAYTDGNLSSASSLSLFSFVIMAFLLLVTSAGKKEKNIQRKGKRLIKAEGKKRFLSVLLSLIIVIFMLPPLLSLVYRAFWTKDGVFTLIGWEKIIKDDAVKEALLTSLTLGLLSSFIATETATTLAVSSVRRRSRLIPLLTSLPLAIGSVTIGLGFSFLSSFFNFRGKTASFVLTLLSHITVILPFALRTILPGAKRISERVLYSALTLSENRMDAYRKVEKPMLRPFRRRAFAFAFCLTLGETNATLALGNGRVTTLPVLIYKMIQQYNYQGASELSLILLVISLTVFAFSERGGDESVIS